MLEVTLNKYVKIMCKILKNQHLKEICIVDTIYYINLKLVIIVYAYFHAQIKQYIVEVNLYFFFFSKKKNYSFLKIKVNKEVIIME